MDEKQAIQCLKRGNIGGLEYLVGQFQLKAIRVAYLITRDLGLAEDVVQDAFLRAFRSMHTFDECRPFEPWFMQSVIHAAVKVVQASARQTEIMDEEADGPALEKIVAKVASVEEQVESTEFQNQIWEAMEKLSPRQRAVIVQKYFLEISEKEMAAESGAAVGTIKWLLNAARERLRYLLAERSKE